jgi:hypothetical protein
MDGYSTGDAVGHNPLHNDLTMAHLEPLFLQGLLHSGFSNNIDDVSNISSTKVVKGLNARLIASTLKTHIVYLAKLFILVHIKYYSTKRV